MFCETCLKAIQKSRKKVLAGSQCAVQNVRRQSSWRPTKGFERILLETQTAKRFEEPIGRSHAAKRSRWNKHLASQSPLANALWRDSAQTGPEFTEHQATPKISKQMARKQRGLNCTQLSFRIRGKKKSHLPSQQAHLLQSVTSIQRTSTDREVLWGRH